MLRLVFSILTSLTVCILLMYIMNTTSPRLFNIFIGILIGITIAFVVPESIFDKLTKGINNIKKRIMKNP